MEQGCDLDAVEARFEGSGTVSQTTLATMTALGLVLLSGQYSVAAQAREMPDTGVGVPGLTRSSAQDSDPTLFSESALVSALLEFHDHLLARQQELPQRAREVLHSNLWQLYE